MKPTLRHKLYSAYSCFSRMGPWPPYQVELKAEGGSRTLISSDSGTAHTEIKLYSIHMPLYQLETKVLLTPGGSGPVSD